MARRPDSTGIRRHGAGWRASVSRGRGRSPIQKHFPLDTPLRVMQDWRRDEQAKLRLTRKQRATAGTFEFDAKRYLDAVAALTTYAERELEIYRWVTIFGQRQRDTITSVEIREARDRWLTEPRRLHPPPKVPGRKKEPWTPPKATRELPYSASAINHWLRALSNLWAVLDGRRAPNPVRDVPEAVEPDALPRALSYATIEQILDAMPDRGQPRKGQGRPTVNLSKLRLRVIAYTGLTYAQLRVLTPEHIDFAAGTLLLPKRRKGKGAKARLLGLLPQAVAAIQALHDADGWGDFSGSSLHSSFMRAARRVLGPSTTVRPYDFRHSFGSAIYRATKSREAVKELLSHGTLAMSERYTLAVADDVLAAQLATTSSQMLKPDAK